MSIGRNRLILLPLFLLLACVGLYAQANSQLTGIVTDQTGAVVSGATITLTDPATGSIRETESGPSGLYAIGGLNPATFNLKVAAKGFQSFEQTGVVVNVSATLRVDVKLTVGAETQTVMVEANALVPQVDSNVVSTLISSEQINSIATQNRNFAALAALGLGVSSALPDSNTPTSVAANFTISVNGLRQTHNIWLIDGGESDDRGAGGGMAIMPSQDAIAEFNVMSSNYPPDYGISSGATMSLSLKSGTQKFHGTLWEFNRTPAYNAKEPISQTLTNAHYNIFGGNIGGPLFIPKVYNVNKQKTFFFWNEEWRKILSGAGTTNSQTLPLADRPTAGTDLHYVVPKFAASDSAIVKSGLVVPVVGDPAYNAKLAGLGLTPGKPFPNNMIPAELFDSNAVLYMNSGILPKPTTSDDRAIANTANPINVRDDIVRIDHKFNDKWAILGHYIHDSVTQTYGVPFLGWLGASYNTVTSNLSNPANSAAIKLSGTISPSLLVEASINYDGNVINITNSANANKPSSWNAGTFFNNGSKLVPSMDGGWGQPYNTNEGLGSAPWHNAAQDYMPKVDVSYIQGKHAMKFGFSYNRYTKNQQLFGNVMGTVGFGSLTNDSMMDMLLGLTNSYGQFMTAPIRHYVNQTPSAYAMDNWHVTPRLSLQVGLRYDALPHAWERSNAVANFNPKLYLSSLHPAWNPDGSMDSTGPGFRVVGGIPYYLNGMGLAGANGFPRGLVVNDYSTLQPRLGFSEDLFGTGKTVLRGGFGTFFERMQGNDIYDTATSPPFAYNPSANSVYFSNPRQSWVTGDTASLPFFPAGINNMPQTYKAPAVAQFSLGVQHEISPSVIWVVQYVGNLAWHQNIQRQINTYPVATDMNIRCRNGDGGNKYNNGKDVCPNGSAPTNLPNSALYRTYQGFGNINQIENTTNGNYNGFQTGVRVQNRWGLSGEVDYTWSHEIDLTTQDKANASNPWNLKYDKGSGFLDRRHILSMNYVYHVPFFKNVNTMTKSLLGGWEVAGTVIAQSGAPNNVPGIGVSLNYDPVGLGGGYTNRPNQNAKTRYPKQRDKWFDTSAFSAPVPAWLGGANLGFGNARKDSVVGPGRVNFTTSLYKNFAIKEAAHFELRFESFNTFNHFEPNGLNTTYGNSQFGKITSAWDPRTLELGGKFVV
jgi:Carboxypeptidase regulatory-like domain